MAYYRRVSPPRKTEAERIATHEALYGAGSPVPERQYRFRNPTMSFQSSYVPLLVLLGAGLLLFWLGKK